MKKRSRYGWLLSLLRYGLCLFALVYLYYNVPWYDHVRLADGELVRLVRQQEDGSFVVVAGGAQQVVVADGVARVGPQRLPDVELGIASVARSLNLGLCLLAVAMFIPVPIMASQRLVWMLRIQEVRLTLWEALKLTLAGDLFNFALPGTTGGDLIKAYYITQYTHHKTEAVTTVFLDRVVGLMGLMLLASVTFMMSGAAIQWDPRLYATLAAGLIAVWGGLAAGAVVVFSTRLRHLFRLSELARRLPAGEHLLRIGRATVAMRRHPYLMGLSLGITLVSQIILIASAWVMSMALHMAGGFVLYFICVPIGFLVAAVPIAPPQGFGVMEAMYVEFLTQRGLNSASQAFAFALAVRVIQLVWAIPGVLVPLLGAHLPRREELEALEEANGPSAADDAAQAAVALRPE